MCASHVYTLTSKNSTWPSSENVLQTHDLPFLTDAKPNLSAGPRRLRCPGNLEPLSATQTQLQDMVWGQAPFSRHQPSPPPGLTIAKSLDPRGFNEATSHEATSHKPH